VAASPPARLSAWLLRQARARPPRLARPAPSLRRGRPFKAAPSHAAGMTSVLRLPPGARCGLPAASQQPDARSPGCN
jgi:hypothetical protein